MKTKFIQPLIWALAFALALPACDKDNGTEPNDPYTPPAEGKVFMPVLVHKVDMEKVKETEKARGGHLDKMVPADLSKDRDYDTYTFKYEGKEVEEIKYEVQTQDKTLLMAKVKVSSNSGVEKMNNLLKKKGFNDDHILAKMLESDLTRESEDDLFVCKTQSDAPGKWFNFEQYEKQRKTMPTIKNLNEGWYDFMKNQAFKLAQVRNFEIEDNNGQLLEEKKKSYGKYEGQIIFAKFRPNEKYGSQILRGYFFDWDEETSAEEAGYINEIIFIYTDPALGHYKDPRHDLSIPTRELLALLKKGGFEFDKNDRNMLFFKRNDSGKTLSYVLRSIGFQDVEDGREIFAMNLIGE